MEMGKPLTRYFTEKGEESLIFVHDIWNKSPKILAACRFKKKKQILIPLTIP
jgi:hypothetical protein